MSVTSTVRVLAGIALLSGLTSTESGAPAPPTTPPSPPSAPPSSSAAAALPWESNHPERKAWSDELRAQFDAKLDSVEHATDIATYCARYDELPRSDRVTLWATLAVAIAKHESGYDPTQRFAEPPPLGVDSIGLFQLSYEDGFSWCRLDRVAKTLEDPIVNIQCAVPEMAKLIARDEVVAAGSDGRTARGLARYWSVMRSGPSHKLREIREATSSLAMCQ